MGKGVHFVFEVVFILKFSEEHDPADRFFLKVLKVLFPGVLPFLGSKFDFNYSVANYGNFGVYLYAFGYNKLIAIVLKIQNGRRVPENSKWRPKWQFFTKWKYVLVLVILVSIYMFWGTKNTLKLFLKFKMAVKYTQIQNGRQNVRQKL